MRSWCPVIWKLYRLCAYTLFPSSQFRYLDSVYWPIPFTEPINFKKQQLIWCILTAILCRSDHYHCYIACQVKPFEEQMHTENQCHRISFMIKINSPNWKRKRINKSRNTQQSSKLKSCLQYTSPFYLCDKYWHFSSHRPMLHYWKITSSCFGVA